MCAGHTQAALDEISAPSVYTDRGHDRIPATHLLDMPNLKWDKEEAGKFYMSREQYDLVNEQL